MGKITLASFVLHKVLPDKTPSRYTQPGSLEVDNIESGTINEGQWRSENEGMRSIGNTGSNNYRVDSKLVLIGF